MRTVSAAAVEQPINGSERGRFTKEILEVPVGRGSIALVRKRLEAAQTRGAVLLIHGFGQNRYTWHLSRRSLANYLAARGYDVFNLELRGHGRSRRAGTAYPAAFDDYVEDAAAAVRAVTSISEHRKVFLFGHSLGGAVSYAAAPLVEAHLAGVVSFAGVYAFGDGQPIFRHLSRAYRQAGAVLDPVLARMLPYVPVDLIGRLMMVGEGLVDHDRFAAFPLTIWYPGTMERDILRERMTAGMDRTGFAVLRQMVDWAASGRFAGTRDYDRDFSALHTPLLVLSADRDGLCTPRDCYPAYLGSESPHKNYRCFDIRDGGGHWGHVDLVLGRRAPVFVWPYVADWLDAHA